MRIKHLQRTYETLETYVCNIHAMQHSDILLQHPDETFETYETPETLETYACNMRI
jgi:hypothetical protein